MDFSFLAGILIHFKNAKRIAFSVDEISLPAPARNRKLFNSDFSAVCHDPTGDSIKVFNSN